MGIILEEVGFDRAEKEKPATSTGFKRLRADGSEAHPCMPLLY